MTATPEIVVVGGRVAGAATALQLARLGHEVVVVDRVNPRSDTLSTHALMRTAVLQLRRWGLVDGLVARGTPAIRHIRLGFGDQVIDFDLADEYGVDALYAPRRHVLDALILDAAIQEGVEFRTAARATGVARDSAGRVTGVVVDDGRDVTELSARFVIGADGMRSRIARSVGAGTYRYARASNAVTYGYFTGVETDGYEFQFTPKAASGLIPTDDGLVNVFVGIPAADVDRDTERSFYAALRASSPEMAQRVEAGRRVGRFRRSPGIPSFLRTPAGPGWALVGDAGFTKDPLSAHGISDAFRDAELIADAVHQAILDPADETGALDHYRQTRDRFAIPLFDEAVALAAHTWSEAEASTRLRTLSAITDAECRFLTERQDVSAEAA